MPVASIGAVLFVAALIARFEGKIPRIRAWMFFGAGATLGLGAIDKIVLKVVHLLEHATDVTSAKFFGTATPLLLLLGLTIWLFFKLIPKGASGHNAADFLMFILPAILTAAGGSWALLSVDANHATTSIMNTIITTVQDLAAGW